jgi:hypothetical protein
MEDERASERAITTQARQKCKPNPSMQVNSGKWRTYEVERRLLDVLADFLEHVLLVEGNKGRNEAVVTVIAAELNGDGARKAVSTRHSKPSCHNNDSTCNRMSKQAPG